METTVVTALVGGVRRERRVLAVLVALALVFAAFVLIQAPAEAAPSTGAVAAAVAGTSGATSVDPQVSISSIVCPVLQAIVAAFMNTPFFASLGSILNALLSTFGCGISGG